MEPNGKSINPPVIGGVPEQKEMMSNERVAPAQSNGQQDAAQPQQGTSNDTKSIVTVLLLIFVYPIGVLVMWLWTKWRWWVKLLASLPFILIFVSVAAMFALIAANPGAQVQKAKFISECTKTYTQQECTQKYMQMQLEVPSVTLPMVK
ncbi:hypothetical protein KBB12_02380 [Candidatus Woesebacteria bacterium]|nr:hypothetical protein [Candidatus Woesebacteria bacterium]